MFSKNKGLAKTNSKELLLNKSGVNSGGKGTEREESMAGKERLMAIRQTIQTQKKASVGELSKICRVTEETIRRDLDKLEADGVVTRVHGGAIWNEGIQKEGVHFYRRMSKHLKEKQEIARKTAKLFEGKTTMIRLILGLIRPEKQSPLNIISTGGEYNKKSLSLQGQLAKTNILKYNVSLALISCKGLSIEKGVLDSNESEAEVKKAMLSQAEEVALLVDFSKFDQSAFVNLIDLQKVNYIITDRSPSEKWIEYCSEQGIELIY